MDDFCSVLYFQHFANSRSQYFESKLCHYTKTFECHAHLHDNFQTSLTFDEPSTTSAIRLVVNMPVKPAEQQIKPLKYTNAQKGQATLSLEQTSRHIIDQNRERANSPSVPHHLPTSLNGRPIFIAYLSLSKLILCPNPTFTCSLSPSNLYS